MSVLRYHISCDTLSIYAFHKIMETGILLYLVKGWDEEEEIKIPEDVDMVKKWGDIYNEYCKMTNDNKALEYYHLKSQLIYLETRRQVAGKLFAQIAMRNMPREQFMLYMDEIKAWGFKYTKKKKVLVDMEDLGRQIKATGNRISMAKAKLEGFETKSAPISLIKQVVDVEQALGRNKIDPKETSVTKWYYMFKKIKELNEERRKKAK